MAKRATTLGQSGRPGGLRLLVEVRYNQQNRSSCVIIRFYFVPVQKPAEVIKVTYFQVISLSGERRSVGRSVGRSGRVGQVN